MVDGVSGVDLLEVLLDARPDAPREDAPIYIPRGVPSPFELLRDEILGRVTAPLQALGRELGEEDRRHQGEGERDHHGQRRGEDRPVEQRPGPQVVDVLRRVGGGELDVVQLPVDVAAGAEPRQPVVGEGRPGVDEHVRHHRHHEEQRDDGERAERSLGACV